MHIGSLHFDLIWELGQGKSCWMCGTGRISENSSFATQKVAIQKSQTRILALHLTSILSQKGVPIAGHVELSFPFPLTYISCFPATDHSRRHPSLQPLPHLQQHLFSSPRPPHHTICGVTPPPPLAVEQGWLGAQSCGWEGRAEQARGEDEGWRCGG